MLIDFCFSASFSAIGGAGVCGIEYLLIYLAGIVDICIGCATRLVVACGVERVDHGAGFMWAEF
jgi:hypothetical protein